MRDLTPQLGISSSHISQMVNYDGRTSSSSGSPHGMRPSSIGAHFTENISPCKNSLIEFLILSLFLVCISHVTTSVDLAILCLCVQVFACLVAFVDEFLPVFAWTWICMWTFPFILICVIICMPHPKQPASRRSSTEGFSTQAESTETQARASRERGSQGGARKRGRSRSPDPPRGPPPAPPRRFPLPPPAPGGCGQPCQICMQCDPDSPGPCHY